jgi:probable HAF family extracellular repeat protein
VRGAAINNPGHVVGIDFFNNAAGELRAFLHDGTTMIDLTEHLSQRKPKGEHSELGSSPK